MFRTMLINALLGIVSRLTASGLVSLVKTAVSIAGDSDMSGKEKFEYVFNIIRDQPEFDQFGKNVVAMTIEAAVLWLKNKKGE